MRTKSGHRAVKCGPFAAGAALHGDRHCGTCPPDVLSLNGVEHDAPSIRNAEHHVKHSSVTVDALDWLAVHDSPSASRHTMLSYPTIDLLLVVDCIYHPSLLPALVDTIDSLAEPVETTVLVVVELRAEDVVREFLQLWVSSGGGTWEIWHAHEAMDGPYAVWVGRKSLGEGQR